jgi:hypothetical protein
MARHSLVLAGLVFGLATIGSAATRAEPSVGDPAYPAWVRSICVSDAPPPRLWVCLDDEASALTVVERVNAIEHATLAQGDTQRRELADILFQYAVRDTVRETRAVRRALVRLGALSPAAARLIPTLAAVRRRLGRKLRRRDLNVSDICRLVLTGEGPHGVLHFEATGNYCADGPFLELRATLGRHGWRILRAEASDTGPP